MQDGKIRKSDSTPEPDMVSIWRGLLAAAKNGEQLTNTAPTMDDFLGISERNDNGEPGRSHSEDSKQSDYEAGLARGREAGYREGYRQGFSDGSKLRNPVRATAATADKPTVGSTKAAAKIDIRLRGLPCANCGRSSYSDELECPGCGTLKAHVRKKLAKVK